MTTRHVEQARARFGRVAFAERLGLTIAGLAHDRAVLLLPYRPDNMNAGGVLNGGASASLVTMTGTLAAWTGVDVDVKSDLRCVDLSVQYLNAARDDDDLVAEARVLRRGRDVVFLDVAVRSRAGIPICQGLLTYQTAEPGGGAPRLRAAHIPLPAPSPLIDPGEHRLFRGYVKKLEMTPVHESPGRVRLRMPCTAAHANENGHLDAGALASIVDIAAVTAKLLTRSVHVVDRPTSTACSTSTVAVMRNAVAGVPWNPNRAGSTVAATV